MSAFITHRDGVWVSYDWRRLAALGYEPKGRDEQLLIPTVDEATQRRFWICRESDALKSSEESYPEWMTLRMPCRSRT
jgi:hypothetical protein